MRWAAEAGSVVPVAVSVSGLVKAYHGAEEPAVDGLDLEPAKGRSSASWGPRRGQDHDPVGRLRAHPGGTRGRCWVFGEDVRRKPRSAFAGTSGSCLRRSRSTRPSTARENLEYFGRMHGLRGTALRARVDEMLAAAGLERAADRPGWRPTPGG